VAAVRAHQAHGDTLGACPPPPSQPANLTVIKQVINDDGGTAQASDFTLRLHIINCDGTLRGAIEFQGSEQGVSFPLNPDVDCGYRVLELVPAGYTLTTDCRRELGDGITPTANYTCIHINNDNPT
jgi:Prealbumin-like fold domain